MDSISAVGGGGISPFPSPSAKISCLYSRREANKKPTESSEPLCPRLTDELSAVSNSVSSSPVMLNLISSHSLIAPIASISYRLIV